MFKFNLYVFNKRSDVKKTQLEGLHFFLFSFFFYPMAGIQREFGPLSATVIGQWVHMRTLGHEVV